VDQQIKEISERVVKLALDSGCQYVDVRGEEQTRNSLSVENSQIENVGLTFEKGIGIRVLLEGSWGFCSVTDPDSFEKMKQVVTRLIKNTRHYSKCKKKKVRLSEISSSKSKINYPVLKEPNLEELIEIALDCDKIIFDQKRIKKSSINTWYSISSKYFVNSDGAKIIQNYTDTIIEMTATSHESGLTQSLNVTEGGRGGLELITNEDNAQNSAREIAQKSSDLLDAKPIKEEKARVILNPDFVALLTHEILGHPSEGDRVLGNEMAWAGGTWWTGKLGRKIGSSKLNVFDDPTIEKGLGWYRYDDEGVETKKTRLIENGILRNHMQSRETAKEFEVSPTGNMRATNYKFMPLIRMACTCIEKGDWSQEEMIKEIKNGYLISNMKIPSIDMNRFNWSISCQYAQKIENGEITDLFRDVIVMDNAPDFFNSIDACGNDFTVRPITNCGKGDPMQMMTMGNGGPSVSGTAIVKSVK